MRDALGFSQAIERVPCKAGDGCDRSAIVRSGVLCSGHLKRRQRGLPLSTPLRPYGLGKEGVLREAALAFASSPFDGHPGVGMDEGRPKTKLMRAARDYLEASDDDAHEKAWARLRMAAKRYVEEAKPGKPKKRPH